jgi:hypothetical protein
MPRHDPTTATANRKALAWRRYRRLMVWMAAAATVAVILAIVYLRLSGGPLPIAMVIATIAGVGFSVLLGTGLMGLVFLSNSSGYDDAASGNEDRDDGLR